MTPTCRRLLLLATTNPNKVREIRSAAGAPRRCELLTLADVPRFRSQPNPARRSGRTPAQKAFAYAAASGLTVVAEDSGLEIAALDGEPGVQSARFLGADVPYPERFAEIYRRLDADAGHARATPAS